MRTPKVLFIYPPIQLTDIETPRPDGSLGPLYLAGALREIGIEADIIDASVGTPEDDVKDTFHRSVSQENGLIRIGMSWERIEEVLGQRNYDIIGIHSNFTPQTRMVLKVAEIAKKINPETLVISGGVNARAIPKYLFRDGLVDLVCTTEGEKVMVDIVNGWTRDQSIKGLQGIPGTICRKSERKNAEILATPLGLNTVTSDLDKLPIPAWDKLPFEKYDQISATPGISLIGHNLRHASMMTSRGCPFRCLYCHISREKGDGLEDTGDIGSYRVKSVDRVFKEIEILKHLGVKRVFLEDDSLLAKKSRVKEIFNGLLGAGLTMLGINGVNLVHFFQRNNVGKLVPDEDYMQLLQSSGFGQIVFPIESGSQRILDKYATAKLKLPIMDVVGLVQVAKKVGIVCPINMMIGFPDESEEEMLMSVDLARKLIDAGAPYVTFFIPIPFPGCDLYDIALAGGYLNQEFDPDIFNWKKPVMENTVVAPQRIEEIREWAQGTVNTKEHVANRIKESAGARRWDSNDL
ncbi:MAG: radical SAM protein [bacterium]|nr:radical SAM protein [bacterium]